MSFAARDCWRPTPHKTSATSSITFCRSASSARIHFLWRPYLPDPKDDSVLELALAGSASFIITHNTRHFRGADALGIRVVTPDQFLSMLHTR